MSDPFSTRPSSVSIEVEDADRGYGHAPSPSTSSSIKPIPIISSSSSLSPPVSPTSLSFSLAAKDGHGKERERPSPPSTSHGASRPSSSPGASAPSSPRISAADLASATAFAAVKKAHFSIGAHHSSTNSLSSMVGATNGLTSFGTASNLTTFASNGGVTSFASNGGVTSFGRPSTASLKASPLRNDQDQEGIRQRKAASRMKSHLLDYTLTDRNNPPPTTFSDGSPVPEPGWFRRVMKSIWSSSSPATSSFPYTPIAKPWLREKSKSMRGTISYWIVWLMFFVGVGIGVFQALFEMHSTATRMLIAPNDGPYGPVGAFMRSPKSIAYPERTADGFVEGIEAGKYLGASQSGRAAPSLFNKSPQPLCLAFDETFTDATASFGTRNPTTGLWEGGRWLREASMNGFGTGEFEMTTAEETNSFIKGNQLFLMPTLTPLDEQALEDGAIYNMTGCTFNLTEGAAAAVTSGTGPGTGGLSDAYLNACSAVSNSTTGRMINPVQSARISTRFSKNIRFGMIEIRAKMPRGDWMWPAMWMLPVPKDELEGDVNNPTKSTDGFYGAWPRSGEIDIVESRGNGIEYTARGRNYVQSSLNWGPTALLNSVAKSYSWWSDKRTGFDEGFHTYRLEWTPDFIRVSIDTRLHTLLDIPFKQDFFTRGDYPDTFTNTSTGAIQQLTNPWAAASEGGAKAAPFDRPFYLILNLAVGSRTGWFPEGQGDKPWLDGSSVAMKSWWEKRAEWLPTWPGYSSGDIRDRALVVDYVKMWEMC